MLRVVHVRARSLPAATAVRCSACSRACGGGQTKTVKKTKKGKKAKDNGQARARCRRPATTPRTATTTPPTRRTRRRTTSRQGLRHPRGARRLPDPRGQGDQGASMPRRRSTTPTSAIRRATQLYAEALLAGGHGREALEVADQLIQLNPDEPSGHEKKGRALLLLEKNEEGLDELRKAVQLDPASATLSPVARHRAQQARQGRRGGARVPRRDQGVARRRGGARAARHGPARPAGVRRGQEAISTRRSSSIHATGARTSSSACSTTRQRSRPRRRPR